MDHQRRAIGIEQRAIACLAQRDCIVQGLSLQLAIGTHEHVGHVSGVMALGIAKAVGGAARREVAASRRKPTGSVTQPLFVNMEGMFAFADRWH